MKAKEKVIVRSRQYDNFDISPDEQDTNRIIKRKRKSTKEEILKIKITEKNEDSPTNEKKETETLKNTTIANTQDNLDKEPLVDQNVQKSKVNELEEPEDKSDASNSKPTDSQEQKDKLTDLKKLNFKIPKKKKSEGGQLTSQDSQQSTPETKPQPTFKQENPRPIFHTTNQRQYPRDSTPESYTRKSPDNYKLKQNRDSTPERRRSSTPERYIKRDYRSDGRHHYSGNFPTHSSYHGKRKYYDREDSYSPRSNYKRRTSYDSPPIRSSSSPRTYSPPSKKQESHDKIDTKEKLKAFINQEKQMLADEYDFEELCDSFNTVPDQSFLKPYSQDITNFQIEEAFVSTTFQIVSPIRKPEKISPAVKSTTPTSSPSESSQQPPQDSEEKKELKRRISEIISKVLHKYLEDGRIESKDEFKSICRKLTLKIAEREKMENLEKPETQKKIRKFSENYVDERKKK